MQKLTITRVPLAELVTDPANARTHDDKNLAAIRSSLTQFGQVEPLVVRRGSNVVIGGNGRLEAMRTLEWPDAAVVYFEGTDAEATALGLALNRTAELAAWDEGRLASLLSEVKADGLAEAAGWTDDEIAAVVASVTPAEPAADPGAEVDRADELLAKWKVEPGDLWSIPSKAAAGRDHRMLCGDSTKAEDVRRVMGGEKANICFTSPPYASQRKYDESSGFKPIHPDKYVEWWDPIQSNIRETLAADGSFFLNIKEHCDDGQRHLYVKDLTIAHVRRWGWMFVDEFAWKRKGVPGGWDNRFKNEWEPIFHFASAATIKFNKFAVAEKSDGVFTVSNRSKSGRASVFDCNSDNGKTYQSGLALPGNVIEANGITDASHNAAFPCSLPTFFLKAFTDAGDIAYEPFSGSGTSIVAAEQTGRLCRAIEISPKYVAVALERLSKMGLEPTRGR